MKKAMDTALGIVTSVGGFLEIGSLAGRLHPKLTRWARAVTRRWSVTHGMPWRIHWTAVGRIDASIHLVRGTPTGGGRAWERWLRRAIIRRLPGA